MDDVFMIIGFIGLIASIVFYFKKRKQGKNTLPFVIGINVSLIFTAIASAIMSKDISIFVVCTAFILFVTSIIMFIKNRKSKNIAKYYAISMVATFVIAMWGTSLSPVKSTNEIADKPTEAPTEITTEAPTESPTEPTKSFAEEHNLQLANVTRVVDGDTIEVELSGKKEKVRFLLVDTPESVHSDSSKNTEYGKVASEYTKNLLEGKEVGLEFDAAERDRYGRLLAYVYLNDQMVNRLLLSEGHAKVAVYQPNVKYVDDFRTLEKEAQTNKKGIWEDGISAFENPTEAPAQSNNNFAQAEANEQANQNVVETGNYVANANTMKFHEASCRHIKRMSEGNKIRYTNRQDAVNAGYQPCKVCYP